MSFKKENNMKNLFLFFLVIFSLNLQAQDWVGDGDYKKKIHEKSPFEDNQGSIVIIEFWVKFNNDNSFKEFNKLKNVTHYYRCNLASNPILKKKYKVRMAPTILIFKDGILEESFRAGLDLECPVTLKELQETIKETQLSNQF
jgi:hypothetical protein